MDEDTIVEFDAFSRGLANEALRHKPENCIIGYITNIEMQAERIRQFKLYEHALECVQIDGINKRRFPHPTGNHSPLHEAIEYITRDPILYLLVQMQMNFQQPLDHLQRESRICYNQTLIMSVVSES